jgi:hypothetical protein
VKPIDFYPAAAEEARKAADHYEGEQRGLGDDFRVELSAALTRIQENPQLYAVVARGIRLCPLHRFSYSVFYEELEDRIWVAAIGHHSRRPGYWSRRRPG